MNKIILLSMLVAQVASAITIPVDLTSGIVTEQIVALPGLEGTPLAGQTIELDIPFTAGHYVRLLPSTPTFISLLVLLVNSDPGGFSSGQGAFLDASLNPIMELPLGSAYSSAFLVGGIVLPTLPAAPLDVYGVRYSVILPSSVATIIGTELRLVGNGSFRVEPVPHVPETGDAAMLLGIGIIGLFCAAKWREA